MYMAAKGKMGMVKTLVRCGADIYAKDFKGKTASTYANSKNFKEIYRFLKKREI